MIALPRAYNSKVSSRSAPPPQIRMEAAKQGVRVHTAPLSAVLHRAIPPRLPEGIPLAKARRRGVGCWLY